MPEEVAHPLFTEWHVQDSTRLQEVPALLWIPFLLEFREINFFQYQFIGSLGDVDFQLWSDSLGWQLLPLFIRWFSWHCYFICWYCFADFWSTIESFRCWLFPQSEFCFCSGVIQLLSSHESCKVMSCFWIDWCCSWYFYRFFQFLCLQRRSFFCILWTIQQNSLHCQHCNMVFSAFHWWKVPTPLILDFVGLSGWTYDFITAE